MAESLVEIGNAATRLIDLRDVEGGRRALMWQGAACRAFPGLSLKMRAHEPQLGTINRFAIGAGELFAIESAPVEVSYRPPAAGAASHHLSLMAQWRGSMQVQQAGRRCDLAEGDLCLIDESSAFRLIGEECSGILFLRLPRGAALSRHPQLE